jgi:hypothetical protein
MRGVDPSSCSPEAVPFVVAAGGSSEAIRLIHADACVIRLLIVGLKALNDHARGLKI